MPLTDPPRADSVLISLIRTGAPLVAGFILTLPINVDGPAVTSLVTALVTALYYGVVRVAERKWPNIGWFLGYPAAPKYSKH